MVDKYLGDTTHLTTEQHGAYLLLLMAMWKRDGRLLNDESQLATIAHMTPTKWRTSRSTVLCFFSIDGDSLIQKRLTEELQRAKRLSNTKAEAGAKGAAKRWQTHGAAIAEPLANPSLIDDESMHPNPNPNPKVKTYSEPSVRTAAPSIVNLVDVIFANGIPLLTAAGVAEKNARSMLGLMRKQHGDDAVVSALAKCAEERPTEPVAWLQATLKPTASRRSKQSDLEARNAEHAAEFSRRVKEGTDAIAT
jgi:uncharacterized protein YdaU (DUF1376 family)